VTREEQARVKESKRQLDSVVKTISKEYGFKTISGYIYKIEGDFVFVVIMQIPAIDIGKKISINLYFKPLILDKLFWEVFQITNAKNMPKSFHVKGAFTAPLVTLKSWKESIKSIEDIRGVYQEILLEVDKLIKEQLQSVNNLSTFKFFIQEQPNSKLNKILIEIQEQQYFSALEMINEEISQYRSGGFADSSGKSFYDYARDYCLKRL
jgi:hypothetical protein